MNTVVQRHNWVMVPGAYALIISACWMAPAKADFPKPIAPPKSERLTPIGPASAGSPAVTTQRADASRRHVPVLIEQLLEGKLTPQKAWDEKLLNADDLLWLFENLVDDWGGFYWRKNEEVRYGLARLLVKHGGAKIQELKDLSPQVRLWLADYFMTIGNERTIALTESILQEIKTKVPDNDGLPFQTIERLARYYNNKGEYQKSITSWLRMADYYATTSRWRADALIEAARLSRTMGDEKRANELYAQIPQHNNGWFSALARYDQAKLLIQQKQYDKARSLLSQPLAGAESAQARIALLSLLVSCCYESGEWESARRHAREASEQFAKVPPGERMYLDGLLHKTQLILADIEQWQQQPLISVPQSLTIDLPKLEPTANASLPLIQFLKIRSFRPATLKVSSDNPAVSAQIIEDGWQQEVTSSGESETEVKVTIDPKVRLQNLRANLAISAPQWPQFKLHVPVRVQAAAANAALTQP